MAGQADSANGRACADDARITPVVRAAPFEGVFKLGLDFILEFALASVAPFGRKGDVLRSLVELVRSHGSQASEESRGGEALEPSVAGGRRAPRSDEPVRR